MTLWFTADTHFGHKAQAWRRGFGTKEAPDTRAHDDALMKAWNSSVQPGDTVYHLGDLSFRDVVGTAEILWKLHGHINLVPGNHDNLKQLEKVRRVPFILAQNKLDILPPLYEFNASQPKPDGTNTVQKLVLCHFPMLTWNRSHYGVMHLHGHSHGNMTYPSEDMRILDVGMDVFQTLISLDRVIEKLQHKGGYSCDHHIYNSEVSQH